ncbi:probable serine/threonine-protein kinase At1g54610 [Arachis duranensis]|uniref:Probable serine/threonine-protein kinase At1g54610 n=1 Tax=Arachis duranensis TaxID=130453 RepID=A0A6P4BW80_ARADU|nr:probable serine/threonine-protein kinase At1g54610 [Arachis duranensis]
MGCITSKSSAAVDDSREGMKRKLASSSSSSKRVSSNISVPRLNSSRRVEDNKVLDGVELKNKIEKHELSGVVDHHHHNYHHGIGRVPKASQGEQVAAGWPTWLSSVAGEAIRGWIPRSANTFEKFYKIGQGTYSTVYKARDITQQKIVALKRVRFDNLDPESVKFMAREILILRRLDHPNVIKLEGLITAPTSRSLYLVFEYMEHDLTGLAANPAIKFSEPQVKCYMKQLLSGLDHCHGHGVLHRDIKGSNLLIDNNGILKIADFGLANFLDPHHNVPLTSRVVTLWYRPPELLLGASHYGVAVDLWSTGCILGELYSGRPILPGKTEVEQLHKIFKLCGSPSEDYWCKLRLPHSTVFRPPHHYRRCITDTFKECPSAAVRLIETLLSVDPTNRGTAADALKSDFFKLEPLACDPSSLPKYPPSKEIDSKILDEATRRQGAAGGKQQKSGWRVRQDNEQHSFVQSKGNVNSRKSVQQGQHCSSSKSQSGLLNSHGEAVSGYLVFPHNQSNDTKEMENDFSGPLYRRPSHSGPLVPVFAWEKARNEVGDQISGSNKANLSKVSGLVASRTVLSQDQEQKPVPLKSKKTSQLQQSFVSTNGGSGTRRRHDRSRLSQRIDISQLQEGKIPTENLIQDGRESMGNKMYLSGPLVVSSNNVDQILKEHDRKIQEYSRRLRNDRSKGDKIHAK